MCLVLRKFQRSDPINLLVTGPYTREGLTTFSDRFLYKGLENSSVQCLEDILLYDTDLQVIVRLSVLGHP
jgi:hypothetical protein